MSDLKCVEKIIELPPSHWVGDGFHVHNFIPQAISQARISPFLMLDYGRTHYFAPSDTPKGVGVHPHRGFETVTIAYKGRIEHHDSGGNSGVIQEGEVQWMTAGSGILHKEYHEKEFSKAGGELSMVQIWVNLPKKHKMTAPKYQGITKDMIVKADLPNNAGFIHIIAGSYGDKIGPATTFTPLNMWNIHLKQGCKTSLNLPQNFNTILLVIEGDLHLNSQKATQGQMVLFSNDGENIDLETTQDSMYLLLSGEPINEPIFHYGPFAMTTREEVMQAFADLEAGKFGVLAD